MSRLLTCSLFLTLCVPAYAQEERTNDEPLLPASPATAEAPADAPRPAAGENPEGQNPPSVAGPEVDDQPALPATPESNEAHPKCVDPEAFPLEPKSIPGLIKNMLDAEGNKYPIIVVQPMGLEGRTVSTSRNRAVEYLETLETSSGTSKEVRKYTREAIVTSALATIATPRTPVFVPLRPNMPCFQLKDGMLTDASALDLLPETHVLVTYTLEHAMELADGIQATYNAQITLTGLKPRLPEYILALEMVGQSDQQNSLTDFLKDASPYRSSVKFFGELPLQDDSTASDGEMTRYFQYPRDSDTAWSYARRAYFDGRYDASEPVLNTLIESQAQEPLVYYLRGLMRYSRGDYQAAETDFANGAELEAVHGYSTQICRDLERVQGPARAALERQRRTYTR